MPDPGAYEVKVKQRLLGALNLKDERTTFADEALYLGKSLIPPYDSSFNIVHERTLTAKFFPMRQKPEGPKAKVPDLSPEPCTYDVDGSFKQSQLIRPRFFIPKGKIVSLSVQASKQKSFVPPPGSYDIDKGYDKITKGAAKGWK
jgi:Sperm-tail PG-rich repeat